jgi:hypothetical protein
MLLWNQTTLRTSAQCGGRVALGVEDRFDDVIRYQNQPGERVTDSLFSQFPPVVVDVGDL